MVGKAKRKNIQAIVRVRPMNSVEIIDKARNIVAVDQIQKLIKLQEKAGQSNNKQFAPFGPFDRVCLIYFIDNFLNLGL